MLSMAVCIAVLAIAAGYTVGVVSQNNVIAQIDVNIGSIETYLEKNHNATQLLTDEFKEDYSAKTRTIAMLLAQDSSFITDDRTLEELRVTVNADMISVADADGNVVASTDPSGAGTSIREEFRSHLEEDVYTDALFLLDSDTLPSWRHRRWTADTAWCRSHFQRIPWSRFCRMQTWQTLRPVCRCTLPALPPFWRRTP